MARNLLKRFDEAVSEKVRETVRPCISTFDAKKLTL